MVQMQSILKDIKTSITQQREHANPYLIMLRKSVTMVPLSKGMYFLHIKHTSKNKLFSYILCYDQNEIRGKFISNRYKRYLEAPS